MSNIDKKPVAAPEHLGYPTSGFHHLPVPIDRGQPSCRRQRCEPNAMRREKGPSRYSSPSALCAALNVEFKVVRAQDRHQLKLHA